MADKKTIVKEIKRGSPPPENAGISESLKQSQVTIPVVEERLTIDKELVEKGTFKIRKTVTEEDVSEIVPANQENVTINRVGINKYVDAAPQVRTEGSTTIIPVIKEVVVVEKKLMLVEEIHITRQRDEVPVEIKDKVRKEHVEITKSEPDTSN